MVATLAVLVLLRTQEILHITVTRTIQNTWYAVSWKKLSWRKKDYANKVTPVCVNSGRNLHLVQSCLLPLFLVTSVNKIWCSRSGGSHLGF